MRISLYHVVYDTATWGILRTTSTAKLCLAVVKKYMAKKHQRSSL